jgi:hypothetical protein
MDPAIGIEPTFQARAPVTQSDFQAGNFFEQATGGAPQTASRLAQLRRFSSTFSSFIGVITPFLKPPNLTVVITTVYNKLVEVWDHAGRPGVLERAGQCGPARRGLLAQ